MILNIFRGRCPHCEKGRIFEKLGNPFLFQMPKMKQKCDVCGHSFEREPGFFFGAMFVSYAVAVPQMVALLLVCKALGLENIPIIIIVIIAFILLSTTNFRLSRTIWMYIFRNV